MKLIDDLLSVIDSDAPVRDIRLGIHWTAVLSRNCGLASVVLPPRHHHGEVSVREAGHLTEKSTSELVHLAQSDSSLEASAGMAAINSLLHIDEGKCVELNAADIILDKGIGRKVAIVGHFPFVSRLDGKVGVLWVLEKYPLGGDIPENESPDYIHQADVVAITGSSFVNHTIENLLNLCNPKAYVIVLGPTTPLSPVLFDYGVDVISGTKVVEPETVLSYVGQGATFRQMKGVRLLTMKR